MKKWKTVVALACVVCLVGLMVGTALAGYLCDQCGGDVTPGIWYLLSSETKDGVTVNTYRRRDRCSGGHTIILEKTETVY